MPRRASWAAMIVPEKPPPTIATGACRSDFIVRPVLRVGGARFARLDVVVDASHGFSAGLGEPARHDRMDQDRAARADQLGADLDGSGAMAGPSHPKRARMVNEQTVHQARIASLADRLFAGHGPSLSNDLATLTGSISLRSIVSASLRHRTC